jgi:hypothetical protein
VLFARSRLCPGEGVAALCSDWQNQLGPLVSVSQTHAGTAAIFVDEVDPRRL